MKKVLVIAAAALLVLLLFFEVDVDLRFRLPQTVAKPDEAQEARYEACVEDFDRSVHAEAFATIDNPDVQREVLYRRMQEAKALCREQYPEITTSVRVPFDFKVFDLTWRY